MLRRGLASASFVTSVIVATCLPAYAEQRALLELFTSQGCSSCPPADRLIGDLALESPSSVIAISLPMDIWDYLGWRDTLAIPAHSALQRAYAHARGDREVYTPQVVVNGMTHVLGSDRAAIEHAIAETDRNPAIMSVAVLLSAGAHDLAVKLKPATHELSASAEVWLCPLATAVRVAIGRGENRGHTITYHNVVRGWRKLGDYDGSQAAWSVPISEIESEDADAAVVMVQEGTHNKPGIILGAAFMQVTKTPAIGTTAKPPSAAR